MDVCSKCGKNEEQVRLFDGLYVNDSIKICERCSLITNIPIIKRPSVSQLKDSEKPYGVRNRLLKMAGLLKEEPKKDLVYTELHKLELNPELEKPEDLVFKLVDNFHWIIQTERRRKGHSTKQLADLLHESEGAIKLLEKGIIPSKSLDLIKALEQLLGVRLIKRDIVDILEDKRKEEEKVNNLLLNKKQVFVEEKPVVSPALGNPPLFDPREYPASQEEKIVHIDDDSFNFDEVEVRSDKPEISYRDIVYRKDKPVFPRSDLPKPTLKNIPSEERPISLKSEEVKQFKIEDLQKLNKKIDDDLELNKINNPQPVKPLFETRIKEDKYSYKKSITSLENKNKVPTSFELFKKKQERDRVEVTGKDIQILDESKKKA